MFLFITLLSLCHPCIPVPVVCGGSPRNFRNPSFRPWQLLPSRCWKTRIHTTAPRRSTCLPLACCWLSPYAGLRGSSNLASAARAFMNLVRCLSCFLVRLLAWNTSCTCGTGSTQFCSKLPTPQSLHDGWWCLHKQDGCMCRLNLVCADLGRTENTRGTLTMHPDY